mmetsp:Transcript_6107/g.12238  ORF Transcript_6107/g.12238 Transcript_6107/m.12238 type:complete len:118 (-) Transcript_6107:1058-1411(-)
MRLSIYSKQGNYGIPSSTKLRGFLESSPHCEEPVLAWSQNDFFACHLGGCQAGFCESGAYGVNIAYSCHINATCTNDSWPGSALLPYRPTVLGIPYPPTRFPTTSPAPTTESPASST